MKTQFLGLYSKTIINLKKTHFRICSCHIVRKEHSQKATREKNIYHNSFLTDYPLRAMY